MFLGLTLAEAGGANYPRSKRNAGRTREPHSVPNDAWPFADGMVEEITIALSRFKWLFAVARKGRAEGKHVDARCGSWRISESLTRSLRMVPSR